MSDINMTPLIDVMLVLVVIFILTAPLLTSSLRLDLPRTDAAKPQETTGAVLVALDKAGQLYLNDKPTTLPDMRRSLSEMAAKNPQAEVQLRADAAVPYGRVVEVMGAVQNAGLNRIGFVAKP